MSHRKRIELALVGPAIALGPTALVASQASAGRRSEPTVQPPFKTLL
jgi:hypothetical protein